MKLSFEYLKQKVGISLLKPANVSAFGRMLSNIFTLQKRETRFGSEYFVKQKMFKQALLPPHAATLLPPLFAHKQGVSEDLWQRGSRFKISTN